MKDNQKQHTMEKDIYTLAIKESINAVTERSKYNYTTLAHHILKAGIADIIPDGVEMTRRAYDQFNAYLLNESGLNSGSINTMSALFGAVCNANDLPKYVRPTAKDMKRHGKINDRTQKQSLSQEQLRRIAELELKHKAVVVRDAFLFAVLTGLRLSDVEQLKHDNVICDGDYYYISFDQKKTNYRNEVPLTKQAIDIMSRQPERGADDRVFAMPTRQTTFKIMNEIGQAVGLDFSLSFHYARHTFASNLLNIADCDLPTVAQMLGHTSTTATVKYLHPDRQRKIHAIEKLSFIL